MPLNPPALAPREAEMAERAQMITLESSISVPDDVLFQDLGGESVILSSRSGKYYGLDEVGTRMWCLLTQHGQIGRAYRAMLDEYDVTAEQLRDDLLALVAKLASERLLHVHDQ